MALIPMRDWLGDYQRGWLRLDLVAGLTTAAVVIPKAMAYATIAGLPVEVGLYTAFVPLVIYAILGTSRPLSVTTTTTLAILTGTQLALVVPNGDPAALLTASATLAILVGAMLILAAVLRLGVVASFISEPVLTGFKAGIGLVIILDQVPKLLGIHFEKEGFVRDIFALIAHLPETSLATLAVGVAMLAILLGVERLVPRAPAPLVAVALGIAVSGLLALQDQGVAIIGHIPQGLPALSRPNPDLIAQLWPGALGIALMSFTESIAAARAFAGRGEPQPQPNRELVATGLGNLVGGLFGAMPGGGGTSQTAVNRRAGARTQVAGLVTAVAAVATLLLLAPLMGLMPQATLAAVVIVYSIGLIQPVELFDILKIRRMEFLWALAAFAGVVVLGTLKGILVAIIVSLVSLAYQAAHPRLYVLGRKPGTDVFRPRTDAHPEDETVPGLLMVRPEGRLFFANAQRIGEQLWPLIEAAEPRVLVMDFSAVIDIEYSALKMLVEGEERLRARGIELWLVALNPEVLGMVQRSSLGETLGRERLLFNLSLAVERFRTQVAPVD
ncbi:SulP family inorganic anion transporter [Allochromatium vinosum]|uniref:Sulfate transporter n=1 Tax=Allochromatium vinosum (strain ATCC 17899 / DSM 180 / NBRC 103801 / NCIMB 10441 / D) TaxID=572477 RepID=D3RSS5_ALLVD|nr:SulP family inorganic anion transporter [Allochromatium vinosum]ADC62234.1 sulfate transporter [Allochromatium vinosum DSM 180]MBK1653547.1 SulP family inorganic anion transporter [Allochromatium vinosum]